MSLHNSLTSTDIHVIHALTYADASARTGATGLVSGDIGKIAKQTDTNRFYILTNHSPVTWSEVTAPSNGGGGINYITNSNSEDSAAGWVAYADAAAVSPSDGTGGSPNVTITRSTSSPLRGTACFLLTKDAANRQGQGVSYDFTIDRADLAKALEISFDFEPTTGFVASSGAVTSDSDLEIYMYDVTNSLLIPVTPKVITSGVGVQQTFKGTFQTASNSSSYRLIIHVASNSAVAYTLKFDNVRVGPATFVNGPVVTDWAAYTPTWTCSSGSPSIGNGTIQGTWRRVGDSMEIRLDIVSGTTTTYGSGGTYRFSAPYAIDFARLPSNDGSNGVHGGAIALAAGPMNTYLGKPVSTGASGVLFNVMFTTPGNGITYFGSGTPTWTAGLAGQTISIYATFPVVGWSSNTQMSSDADTRVVAAFTNNSTPTGTLNTSDNAILFPSMAKDTHSSYNAATGEYTIPVSGQYLIEGAMELQHSSVSAGNEFYCSIYKDGSRQYVQWEAATGTSPTRRKVRVIGIVDCTAGNKITLRSSTGGTGPSFANAIGGSDFSIMRISGPAAIAATEKVYAFLQANGAGSVTAGTTNIDWTSKTFDSHGAWSTNIFTAPKSGWYEFKGVVNTASINTEIYAWINGVNQFQCGPNDGGAATTTHKFAGAYYLKAGDTLAFRVGNTTTLSNSASQHWLSIASQG